VKVIGGIDALGPDDGPVFAVVGVFDGLHLGHLYLLDALEQEAARRGARSTVITFDHHPDELINGVAPPLLLDPEERLERLAAAGIDATVVQHFDDVVRHTTYDAFIARISTRTALSGLLMTPDAAFGYERRGTPESLATLGARDGFDVVVIPTFTLDGRSVRSSDIRAAMAAGDLDTAAALLGRPVTITAIAGRTGGDGRTPLHFGLPLALPPNGRYPAEVNGTIGVVDLVDGAASLSGAIVPVGRVVVRLSATV
jgi:riboflavin kinase/FMN adenylyltransferase